MSFLLSLAGALSALGDHGRQWVATSLNTPDWVNTRPGRVLGPPFIYCVTLEEAGIFAYASESCSSVVPESLTENLSSNVPESLTEILSNEEALSGDTPPEDDPFGAEKPWIFSLILNSLRRNLTRAAGGISINKASSSGDLL